MSEPDLTTELAPGHPLGLRLRNPVMTASGTFGYGTEYASVTDIQRLGAIISKGTTLQPRAGNPALRVVETAAGMLNAIGLQNPGIDELIRQRAPIWAGWTVPVIVNIAGETLQEFVTLASKLEGVPGVAGIELNISCPNLRAGASVYGSDAEIVAETTAAVRQASSLPLIVKLSPNVSDLRPIARAAAEAGANAISLINTITGMKIDIHTRQPLLANVTGGLSGPAIKPIALRMVYEVAQELRAGVNGRPVPIIGIGGISNLEDALEFLMAGASAIQLGSINFINPRAGLEITDSLQGFLRRQGMSSLQPLIGAALPTASATEQPV
ncbi:MAG TPA: dihydroorotate dehydrogenase [Ktedonobacterales bacterium]|jgi:dihydroorotate dehydrogenase (NAD+) catalytic subunit